MVLDPRIILQGQAPQFDSPVDVASKAMNLKRLATQNQLDDQQMAEAQGMRDAFKNHTSIGPDGKVSMNRPGILAELAKVNPQKALETEKSFGELDAAEQKRKLETVTNNIKLTGQLLGTVQDQASYDRAMAEATRLGLPNVETMPRAYDPSYVRQMQVRALDTEKQLDQIWKQKEFGLKQEELSIKRQESKSKNSNGEKLPIDKKKVVETLASKNANKLSIANQIDAVMGGWDKLSEDQKVTQGRMLLKTLNSPEGADAIGTEEANRLGSKLEFALGNFTNSNPTQFGRDLDGFKAQAINASKFIKQGVKSNKSEIDQAMGRQTPQSSKPTTVVQNGFTYTLNPETGEYE